MSTHSPSFASDELLSRLDGLLADLRTLRAEVHELSADATARHDDGGATKKKHKKRKKAKGKKKAKARHD